MTDSQLEEVIKKVRIVSFQSSQYSYSTEKELPGYINFKFNDEHLYDVIEMHKYLTNELAEFKKIIHVKQTKADRIDFTMIIEKEPAIVLTIKDIECNKDRFETFLKKESQDKPTSLLIERNQKPDNLEIMAERAEAATKAELYHPIPIHSWKGFPLQNN